MGTHLDLFDSISEVFRTFARVQQPVWPHCRVGWWVDGRDDAWYGGKKGGGRQAGTEGGRETGRVGWMEGERTMQSGWVDAGRREREAGKEM